VKAIKTELQKASEVLPVNTYTYALPQGTDKLQLVKVIVSYENDVIARMLEDIQNGLPGLTDPQQVVTLLKILKSVISLFKEIY